MLLNPECVLWIRIQIICIAQATRLGGGHENSVSFTSSSFSCRNFVFFFNCFYEIVEPSNLRVGMELPWN